MNALDWVVLLGTMVGIAAYGAWHTRHTDHLDTYLKGSKTTGWFTIGVSVMATQASAITFLSIPGQGFESGVGFVQNYFGLPLALILGVAAWRGDLGIWRYALPIAGAGVLLAGFHSLVYFGIIPEAIAQCGAGPSCTDAEMTIFGLAIPVLSLAAFVGLVVLLATVRKGAAK